MAIATVGSFGVAWSDPAPKVTVCKQVGQPGNSRPQHGDGTIEVSQNAVEHSPHFNDAQGSSVANADGSCGTPAVAPTPQESAAVAPAAAAVPVSQISLTG
ncbi:MAG: hypothetical protein MUP97_15440 [Acidimicrobiia bacterium]|nr:hypothetical protein [Acidimicrobiia bacterium]